MICVVLGGLTVEECEQVMRVETLVELRLDMLPSDLPLDRLLKLSAKAVVTYRPATKETPEPESEQEHRRQRLLTAINAGAAYIDIECEAPAEYRASLVTAAHAAGCNVIISYHNFECTPATEELLSFITQARSDGADLVKLACHVQDTSDNARLLGLLEKHQNLIVVGMGGLGVATRIVASACGAAFTFACPTSDRRTAPGQLTAQELREIEAIVQRSVRGGA